MLPYAVSEISDTVPNIYNLADISTLKPSSASFTPNFSHLKPLKSVKNVTNFQGAPVGFQEQRTADFKLKDFSPSLERKKSGRSTLV